MSGAFRSAGSASPRQRLDRHDAAPAILPLHVVPLLSLREIVDPAGHAATASWPQTIAGSVPLVDMLRTSRIWACRMRRMPIRPHKLVVPWLLICPSVLAARLPVPPVPPAIPPPAKLAHVSQQQGLHSSTKPIRSRKTPIPPIPPRASRQLAKPAPVPDWDTPLPPDPNSSPHTKVSVADFRRPLTADSGAGFPHGSQFQSREDARPIQTLGLTLTIPLRLP
jgi:hypothetical protein